MRPPVTLSMLAALAAGALALSACGSAAAPGGSPAGSPGGGTPSGPGAAPHPKAELRVTMTRGSGGPVTRWSLRCAPAGGTMPDPAAACAALSKMKARSSGPFAGPAKNVACPAIMMSDRRIVMTGTWYGTQVHRVILDGGCDMGLFGTMFKLLR